MDTPEEIYTGLSQDQLFGHLASIEQEIAGISYRRSELNAQERNAEEHREAIQRALGVVVLDDHRDRLF